MSCRSHRVSPAPPYTPPMLIYAGIDEAGYGPMLGPLTVGLSAFELPEQEPGGRLPDLWRTLRSAVCRSRRDARRRIAVEDSKHLKGASGTRIHPLRHLERGVLGFCGTGLEPPEDDDALLRVLRATIPPMPWYDAATRLPVGQTTEEVKVAAGRLRRGMERAGVRLAMLRCELIDAESFNDQVDAMGCKSNVNFCAAMRLLDAVWRRWPEADPQVVLDRQGGRTRYREVLQQTFPEASIQVLLETAERSAYRLTRSGSTVTAMFRTTAESAHLPVALASMVAKYARELVMIRLNRFFSGHVPELKPTAGYVTDARRYLRDVAPVISSLNLRRESLIRKV